MTKDQYKVILETVRKVSEKVSTLSEDVNRIDRDLSKDRMDLSEFRVRLGTLEEEIKSMKGLLVTNADKVGDRVTDALEQPTKEVVKLTNEIKKSKKIIIVKNSFVDWLKKRFMGKVRTVSQEVREEVKGSE